MPSVAEWRERHGPTTKGRTFAQAGPEPGLRREAGGVPVGAPFGGGWQVASHVDMSDTVAARWQTLLGEAQLQ